MPGVCRCDLTNACAFYHYHCTRGYRAHRAPGIPCALFFRGSRTKEQTSRKTCGEIAKLCTVISPPSTRPCAWRGGVGGGGSISRNRCFSGCRTPPPPPPPPPPRALAGGGEGLGVGGLSAGTAASVDAAPPPTPDPSPPLRGGRGATC